MSRPSAPARAADSGKGLSPYDVSTEKFPCTRSDLYHLNLWPDPKHPTGRAPPQDWTGAARRWSARTGPRRCHYLAGGASHPDILHRRHQHGRPGGRSLRHRTQCRRDAPDRERNPLGRRAVTAELPSTTSRSVARKMPAIIPTASNLEYTKACSFPRA